MADHPQKIHPVHEDVEAPPPQPDQLSPSPPPTVPLMPKDTSRSDNTNIPQRTIPVHHTKPPKRRRSCLCKCFCWTLSLLLILIILIASTVGILYLAFRPKLPKYSVDRMQVTQFNLTNESNLKATLNVTITARNPNKRIGIYYEGGSHISVWYTDTKLCEGSIPKFYQGHENTTVLNLPLAGETQNATSLAESVQLQLQQTGNVPLNLRVDQPVRVKLGKLKLMEVKFLVRCRLLVDSLSSTDNAIRIQDSKCKFRFRL
ncbi:hypothetical protein ACOSP7_026502 [Xanthoceras sorbifolium]